jgi:hypothetical protein
MKNINESLDYLDMEDQIKDIITVDEYAAKMGQDKDIVTITFTVNSKLAAKDLVSWLERGYNFVLDASVSEGEINPGQYLVFVEMDRRSKVPERIISVLSDLETLTGIKLSEWTVEVGGNSVAADETELKDVMILNPNEYKMEKEVDEKELNEMRLRAGIDIKSVYVEDEYIKNLKAIAGM